MMSHEPSLIDFYDVRFGLIAACLPWSRHTASELILLLQVCQVDGGFESRYGSR